MAYIRLSIKFYNDFTMKAAILSFILFLSNLSAFAGDMDKVLYGDDNRVALRDLSIKDENLINLAHSVLAQVPLYKVASEDKNSISFRAKNISDSFNMCLEESYSDQPSLSNCSGFLVGSDLLMTAGHCIKETTDCQKNFWILDFDDDSTFDSENSKVSIDKEKIFTCSKILAWSNTNNSDFALIKLNKKIKDRHIFKMHRLSHVKQEDSLFVIGHPLGMPKMFAMNAHVRENYLPNQFKITADTFSGNSGSPVVNLKTLSVEGILIKGENDFKMDINLSCNRTLECNESECRGETVQRASTLPFAILPNLSVEFLKNIP
jgi:V8-like Glu-specific endopeptidase